MRISLKKGVNIYNKIKVQYTPSTTNIKIKFMKENNYAKISN